jgi:phenylalanyl-tRNA synthetase beta chain
MEEIARIYGYDKIPETRLAGALPPQRDHPRWSFYDRVRDNLVGLGLQEAITYRLTSAEWEAKRFPPGAPPDDKPYLGVRNPISIERNIMRHSLLASLMEVVARNARYYDRQALFDLGPIFLAAEEGLLPDEHQRLAIVLTGPRHPAHWQGSDQGVMDFYDLKGVVDILLESLHLEAIHCQPHQHPSYHPGKCARIMLGEQQIGILGEMHPLVQQNYDLNDTPLLAAELDLDVLLPAMPEHHAVREVSPYPPVLEDLALVVDESVPAADVARLIWQAGGAMLVAVRLFDVYRGEQVGAAKKSLAYSLTYQAPDRTLTDQQVAALRQKIITHLEQKVGAQLRA